MINKSPLVILGSARSDGQTRTAIDQVLDLKKVELVDLLDLSISHYDYEHQNKDDDFIPLAEKMLNHQTLILATPVYWYTMSAIMKIFLDRWSDLLTIRKDLGRALANKQLFVITSYGSEFPTAFETPFQLTCQYMNMQFGGCYYYYSGNDHSKREKNGMNAEHFKHLLPAN